MLGGNANLVFSLRRMRILWPWLCALFSGILLALAFPPADLGGLAWFALVPLIWALWFSTPWKRNEPARLFLLGYVTGAGYFIGCFAWIVTVTTSGWLALSLYLAIYPALWALFIGLIARPRETPDAKTPVWLKSIPNLFAAILTAASWTALEWLRGVVFTGFGWNGLGIALHDNIALIQICDITGVGGLSFLLVMVNTMTVLTIKRLTLEIGRHRIRPHYDFSMTVALVALVFGYGVRQLFAPPKPSETMTIAAIQANVPVHEKRDPEHEERILQLHTDLSEKAIALKPDLLIWPEAATPEPVFNDQHNWDVVRAVAEKFTGDFMLGTVYFAPQGAFNSAVLLTEQSKKAQLYHKIHLVPFGEYVPLRESFPLFAWIVGSLVPDDFDFGREYTVFQMKAKPVKIGPLICFEDTLGDLARQFVKRGAQVFVTVTNDGWFLESAESRQHLNQAIFRGAETKIPMVRTANTGITCTIDGFGRIQKTLTDQKNSTFLQGFLIAAVEVPKKAPSTFYTRYGEIFSVICLAGSIAAIGAGFLKRKHISACPPPSETKSSTP
jgi:apolipoprotein N-acyltransferase